MENASKALIIAGAVLLAILLIGVGMLVFNAANKPISESTGQMDEQAIIMHNSKFTPYIGDSIPGSSVRELANKVIAHNSQNNTSELRVWLRTRDTGSSSAIIEVANQTLITKDNFKDTNYYKVKVNKYRTDGRISIIGVFEN